MATPLQTRITRIIERIVNDTNIDRSVVTYNYSDTMSTTAAQVLSRDEVNRTYLVQTPGSGPQTVYMQNRYMLEGDYLAAIGSRAV